MLFLSLYSINLDNHLLPLMKHILYSQRRSITYECSKLGVKLRHKIRPNHRNIKHNLRVNFTI